MGQSDPEQTINVMRELHCVACEYIYLSNCVCYSFSESSTVLCVIAHTYVQSIAAVCVLLIHLF